MSRPIVARSALALVLASGLIAWSGSCTPSHDAASVPADPGDQGAANLVANPRFQAGPDAAPAGWIRQAGSEEKGAATLTDERAHSTPRSLVLRPNARNVSTELATTPLAMGQGIEAAGVRGDSLYVSAWLAAEGGAAAVCALYAHRTNGQVLGVELRQTSPEPDFTQHQDVLLVPDDDETRFLVFRCAAEGTAGAAWFDDVYVGTAPPGISEEPDTGAVLHARITVNAAERLHRIPSTVYGTNIGWIWDGSGLWEPGPGRLNDEAVALTREMGVQLIRFPEGSFADFYHWREGVGPADQRPTSEPMPGSDPAQHTFGTDEALAFADRVGASLMITVNTVTGTEEEAADWVRYVNKPEAGTGEPRVLYWEIGNESYIRGDAAHTRPANMTPEEYTRRFLGFARAMKAADPRIRVGAISDVNYTSSVNPAYPGWTEHLLREAGQEIDFISVHNAYAPMLATDGSRDLRSVYRAMVAAPELVAESLARVTAMIERYGPRDRNIEIAVTEWGPYFHPSPEHPYSDHVKTLGSALYAAGALGAIIDSPRTTISNFFKLTDPLNMGWIGRVDESFRATAPYYAFRMYTEHFGEWLVQSSASGPVFASARIGWVDALQDVPYLDARASVSRDGRTLHLMVVNRHFEAAVLTEVEIRDFEPASGTAWTLTGPEIDAHTGTRPYQTSRFRWSRQAQDPKDPHFYQSEASSVRIVEAPMGETSPIFTYAFPPHTVTSLELRR